MTEDEITPGERIKRAIFAAAALRGVKGSEPAVALATRVSRNTLRRLFDGGEPDGAVLSKIATSLGTTPDSLLAAREGRTVGGLDQIANEIRWLREALVPGSVDDELTRAGADAIGIAREGPAGEPAEDPPSEQGASVQRRTSAAETRPR